MIYETPIIRFVFTMLPFFSMTQKMKKMRSNNGTLIYIFFVNLHVQHIIPFYHNHIHVCFLIRMLHLEKWSFFRHENHVFDFEKTQTA